MTKSLRYSTIDKATICSGNTCMTVYGETARVVQQIALMAVIIAALTMIAKAIR
ncbi:hypothetical protein [Ferruginibacter sp. HRS2-29]|uniref:hypothetical protein n=1 Tax=Ferruginibacter sp. HRS2-29 TaxID=2487334 RepID=UPI0020CF17EE|nr:hypothetical protein [Ferruginibacter sp. HRS2-29]